jgi:hypothetical protein
MDFCGLDLLGADDSLESVRAGGAVLKKGSKGDAVKTVQLLLGVDADGDFGSKTENVVKAFQGAHGLTADGIVGKGTLAALETSTGVTKVDFAEGETVTASIPKIGPSIVTGPDLNRIAANRRNLAIGVGLAALGAAGLIFAWK